jgi:hypothetical protein
MLGRSFVSSVISDIRDSWPSIYRSIKATPGGESSIADDQEVARNDLALAYTADQILNIRRIFPESQTKRLEELLHKSWEEYSHHAWNSTYEIKAYLAGGQQTFSFVAIDLGSDPENSIPHRLLYQWMGDYLLAFVEIYNFKTVKMLNPILILQTRKALKRLAEFSDWSWQRIQDTFEITPE